MKFLHGALPYIYIFMNINFSYVVATKRRLCVEYKIQNSRWSKETLSTVKNTQQSECLRRCGRHPICMAYNWFGRNGTCELLPGLGDCAETEEHSGSLFVHLGNCQGRTHWDVGRRNWSSDAPCLTWVQSDSDQDCPANVLRDKNWVRCVSMTPHKGLYLPGWFNNPSFRVVTEQGLPNRCTGPQSGYLLYVDPQCPIKWQDYTAGDPIPSQAIKVSSWKDGRPLYLVCDSFHSGIGYYIAHHQLAFIMMATTRSPSDMLMLVYDI